MACKKKGGSKVGAVAGLAAAAVVAKKVMDNNPGGVQDLNGDGKVDVKDYAIAAKDAVKNIAEDVKEKAPELKEKAGQAVDFVKEKVEEFKED